MANNPSAKKRSIQSEKRRVKNVALRSQYRTHLKKVILAIRKNNKELATKLYKTAVPIIDKMVNKGIIHKNKAARYKSRLNARLKKMGNDKTI